jgi:glycosyltransferase involved in cell wall biosynthesis
MRALRTIVQLAVIDETGDSYYRMRWPAAQLAQFEPSWRVINLHAASENRLEWAEKADLLVLYQCADLELLPVIRARRERGRKTLVEYNDNYYAPQAWSPIASEWQSPLLWQKYERVMQEGDALIVTGPGLLDLFSAKYPADKIHIIENFFPHEPEPFASAFPTSSGVTLGWGGSLGHMADFLSIAPILKEILEETPQTKLRIMGNRSIPELVAFPPDRFEFVHWGSVHDYFKFWRPVHLGVAPLLDTPYNRCRSDIKAVEMSACGVLPLLPDALPYRKFIADTGIKPFRNFQELKERIAYYVMRPEQIRKDAECCYEYVKSARLGMQDRKRLQLYAQMMSGKSEAFDWGVAAGYHEVTGKLVEKSSIQEVLAVADGFLKLRQHSDALSTVERALSANPAIPELALAKLKILKGIGNSDIKNTVVATGKKFPDDLRFKLVEAQCATNAQDLQGTWKEIIEKLQSSPLHYREFFRTQVVKLLLTFAQASPEMFTPLGESLVGIYPDSADLRFFLAQVLERQGNQARSLEHYSWLRAAKKTCAPNTSILQPGAIRSKLAFAGTSC